MWPLDVPARQVLNPFAMELFDDIGEYYDVFLKRDRPTTVPTTPSAPAGTFIAPLVSLLGAVDDGLVISNTALALLFAVHVLGGRCAEAAIEAGVLRHLASAIDPAVRLRRNIEAEDTRAPYLLLNTLAVTAPPPVRIHEFRAAGLFPLLEAAAHGGSGCKSEARFVLETLRILERSGGDSSGDTSGGTGGGTSGARAAAKHS